MKYRALVGMKKLPENITVEEKETYIANLLKTQMKQWDSTQPVMPYPDNFINPDEIYARYLKMPRVLKRAVPRKVDIDNPANLLNFFGAKLGQVYFTEIPKAWEGKDLREPARRTKVYAYSIKNPNGYFDAFEYPIKTPFNGISTETSRLTNTLGAYHDCVKLKDLDFESTYMPEIAFRYDGEVCESDDPAEMKEFLNETMDRDDLVFLVECNA